jgi:Protein of unknown function (DUF3788)
MLRPLFAICDDDGKAYNGAVSLENKSASPDERTLAGALGPSKKLWDAMVAHITETYPPVSPEWTFYKSWSLRLKHKKRTVLYLLPRDGRFLCAFVFGAKATEAARQAGLPKAIMKAIDEAPVYAEGRGFRLEVRTARDVETMKRLAAIKMAN